MEIAMDGFLEELISNVVSFLPEHRIAPFATISSEWQQAVARRTFSDLSMKNYVSLEPLLVTLGQIIYLMSSYLDAPVSNGPVVP